MRPSSVRSGADVPDSPTTASGRRRRRGSAGRPRRSPTTAQLELTDRRVQPGGRPQEVPARGSGSRPRAGGSQRSSDRGSRLRATGPPTSSRSSTSRLAALGGDDGRRERGRRARRAVGSPSGRPASRSVPGPAQRPRAGRACPSASSSATARRPARAAGRRAPAGQRAVRVAQQREHGRRARGGGGRGTRRASGRPCGWASTTTATGRPRGRRAAPTLRTAVSHGARAVTGRPQRRHQRAGGADLPDHLRRGRRATRVNTPRIRTTAADGDRRRLWWTR